jgi:DNA-binding MarR family transcriptional regulator
MSTDGVHSNERAGAGPGPELTSRLGYLLKHAQLSLRESTDAALAPHGLTGRDLAVLLVLDGSEPPSQQQAAQRLGVDRTTMVALIDRLQDKGLVTRQSHTDDRRKNVVELTTTGLKTLRRAVKANDEAERRFLEPLSTSDAQQLKAALLTLLNQPDR